MQNMTIEQLRSAHEAGGVEGVTLKGQGGVFLVQIATHSGSSVLLAKARSSEPRSFGNPIAAFNVLRDVGITIGKFDASGWDPTQKVESAGNRGRADAMREAHEAAAYSKWLASEIQDSMDDPRLNMTNEEVMSRLDSRITSRKSTSKKSG